jgi:hypothetical protein
VNAPRTSLIILMTSNRERKPACASLAAVPLNPCGRAGASLSAAVSAARRAESQPQFGGLA